MAKKEKQEVVLTEAEKKRLAQFETMSEEMVGKGYRRKDLTIGMGKANLFSILLFIPLFIVGYGTYYLVHGELGFSKFNFFGTLMADAAGGDLMILHQLFSYKSDAGEVIYADHPTEAGLVVFERD